MRQIAPKPADLSAMHRDVNLDIPKFGVDILKLPTERLVPQII
jgi:hypothetical protein